MKVVLLATDCAFWERNRGGFQRISQLVLALAARDLRLHVFFTESLSREAIRELEQEYSGVSFHASQATIWKGRSARVSRVVRRLVGRLTRSRIWAAEPRIADHVCRVRAKAFAGLYERLEPDWVMIERVHLTYLLRQVPSPARGGCPRVIDTVDVLSSRCRSFHHYGEPHWLRVSRGEERRLLRTYDVIVAIQDQEAEELHRLVPHAKVVVAGHAPDVGAVSRDTDGRLRVAYFATGGGANRLALKRFIERVWLQVPSALEAELVVAGGVSHTLPWLCETPRCTVLGEVATPRDLYRMADIVVNPVLFGGGLKIKNVEALCAGRALLTTAVGAEGLSGGVDQAFLVCDTDEKLLSELCTLLGDQASRERLAQAALDYAARALTPEAAYGELVSLLLGQTV